MAGGYAILTDTVLSFGENDVVDIYGSVEAAVERFYNLSRIGKPILAKFRLTGDPAVLCGWFEFVGFEKPVYTWKSSVYTMRYDASRGILSISLTT